MSQKKPLQPVKPIAMEIIYLYPCPFCNKKVAVSAPLQPSMIKCDGCFKPFPVVPADENSIKFIKLILDEGRAGIAPDFI